MKQLKPTSRTKLNRIEEMLSESIFRNFTPEELQELKEFTRGIESIYDSILFNSPELSDDEIEFIIMAIEAPKHIIFTPEETKEIEEIGRKIIKLKDEDLVYEENVPVNSSYAVKSIAEYVKIVKNNPARKQESMERIQFAPQLLQFHKAWKTVVPYTLAEALSKENQAERMSIMEYIPADQFAEMLQEITVETVEQEYKHLWLKDYKNPNKGTKENTVKLKDEYILLKVKDGALKIENLQMYIIKCNCTSTRKVYYLEVAPPVKGDTPIDAIRKTFIFPDGTNPTREEYLAMPFQS